MPTRDSSSPARFFDAGTSGATQTWTSPSFSPPADSWLYLHVCGNDSTAGQTPIFGTPTNTGTALTWTLVSSGTNANGGAAAVWRAYNATAQASITVTDSILWSGSAGGANTAGAWIDVWTGCNTTQTGAAASFSTSSTQTNNPSITTTASGSRVAGMMLDWGATGSPTSSDTIDAYNVASQTSGCRVYKSSDSGASGSVSLNMVAGGAGPIASLIVYEILASNGVSLAWLKA